MNNSWNPSFRILPILWPQYTQHSLYRLIPLVQFTQFATKLGTLLGTQCTIGSLLLTQAVHTGLFVLLLIGQGVLAR